MLRSTKISSSHEIVIIFVLSLFPEWIAANSNLKFELKQTFTKAEVLQIRNTDLDYDNIDEYIVQMPQEGVRSAIRIYSGDFQRLYFQKNFQSRVLYFNAFQWIKPGVKELLLIEQDGHDINLLLLDGRSGNDTLAFINLHTLESEAADINITNPYFQDLNGDDIPEIFIPFCSGLHKELRAVLAVDVKACTVLWKFDTATNVRRIEVAESDNVPGPILLISNQATNNGCKANGMTDSYSYLLLVDAHTGKVITQKQLGGYPSYTDIYAIADSDKTYICSITPEQNALIPDAGVFCVWDITGKTLVKRLPNVYMDEYFLVADINNDGNDEILRSGHTNKIIVYNAQLNPIDTFLLFGNKCYLHKVLDLNHDGFVELVLMEDKTDLIVASHQGEILGKNKAPIGDVRAVGKGMDKDTSIGIYDVSAQKYTEWTILPNLQRSKRIIKDALLGFFAGVGLCVFILLVYIFY